MISLHHFFSYTHPPGPVMTSISVSTTSHRRSQGLQSHGQNFLRLLARWGAQQSNPQHVFAYVPRCFPVVFYAPGYHLRPRGTPQASTRKRITSYKHTLLVTYTTLHSLCFSRRSNTQHIPKMKVAWSALCALSLSLPSMAIDTVPSLDVKKYLGRWYQVRGGVRGTSDCCCPSSVLCCVQPPLCMVVCQNTARHLQLNFISFSSAPNSAPVSSQLYGNEYTSRITRDTTCIAADYGLVSPRTSGACVPALHIHS